MADIGEGICELLYVCSFLGRVDIENKETCR